MNKIAKLRKKLREAEERGYTTALDMMQQFVDHRRDVELTHRPDTNIYKRTISETYNTVEKKIHELQGTI